MTHLLEDLTDFLSDSPTSWHAVREMGNRLASLEYTPLDLKEPWSLEKGKKYFVIHEGSLAVFALPKKKPKKMALVAAHTDSPALKLKPRPQFEKENMVMLGVEVYGGPILPTWFNRDLAIAGRVVTLNSKESLEEHLVYFDDAPLMIPLLAPHLDREAYKTGLTLDKEEHLVALAALKQQKVSIQYIERLLQRNLTFFKLLDFDLFLVPIEPPRFIGEEGEMLASYRLDNLCSAHAGIIAFGNLEKVPEDSLPMGIFWDHEEVGSATHIGAGSPFFQDIFERINQYYQLTYEETSLLKHNSLCLSVDVTHGFNPNFAKKYEPRHLPLLGEGITLKYHAGMRYSTSALTGSILSHMCQTLQLKCQQFVNRADNPAGSTVGPIFSTELGIATVDIGIPQLSMHAAREIISWQDHIDMCTLLTHFIKGDFITL